MKKHILAMLITASLLISPVVVADENMDIPANAQATGSHDILVDALIHAGLVAALQQEGPYTVFAPTDDAFAAAGIDLTTYDTDEKNSTLSDILLYHVVLASVTASDLTDGMTAQALNGDDLSFTVTNGAVMVNDANVTTADVIASNGVIHVIDKVLMPPVGITEADGDICYNTHTHAISAGASFEECTSYAYYVDANFGGMSFTGCYNMFTHVPDASVSQEICEAYVWTPAMNIAMTAQATTIHTALVAALAQAELVETLQGTGPFTVFAPTDEAFAAAGIDLAALDTVEGKATLTDILLYHVVSGSVPASAVTDGMSATAVNEDDLSFTVAEGVMVNDANVVLADVPASNGVIHVIDKVLMPPADLGDIPSVAQATTIHTALVAALAQAELVETLQGTGPFTVFAPTDEAFAAAGIDLAALDTVEGKATLTDILLYHVVSGSVPASAVTDGMSATAVNEDDLSFTVAEGVMVNDANVVLADVPASNGVIHVIDKVLMPPADEPAVPEGCDYVVGIDETGFAFDNVDLSVAVGETVCWIWNDESMAHNVAEIDSEGDTSRKMGGAYSGQAETTVDYRITFDEDGTFHYICEPHVSMDMVGVVTVGTGVAPPPPSAEPDSESVPGFLGITVLVAMLGAALVAGRRNL